MRNRRHFIASLVAVIALLPANGASAQHHGGGAMPNGGGMAGGGMANGGMINGVPTFSPVTGATPFGLGGMNGM